MGFGYLLYGFLMMLEVGIPTSYEFALAIDIFPNLAGYLLMLTAARRLSPYAEGFARFRQALYPLLVLGGAEYIVGILSIFWESAVLAAVSEGIICISLVLQPLAFFFLFSGIVSLAGEVGLPKIVSRARFSSTLGLTYYLLQLLLTIASDLSLSIPAGILNPLHWILLLLWIIFLIFSEVTIFGCYMYICYEGEENVNAKGVLNPFEKLVARIKKGKDDK